MAVPSESRISGPSFGQFASLGLFGTIGYYAYQQYQHPDLSLFQNFLKDFEAFNDWSRDVCFDALYVSYLSLDFLVYC